MSSRMARSLLWTMAPSGVAVADAVDGGEVAAFGDFEAGEVELVAGDEVDRARPASRLSPGCTATLAPTKPILSAGLASFSAAATFTSEAKEGVLVCMMTRSRRLASARTGSRPRLAGGASISLLPGTRAAGWASQVGYQNERISRLAW